MVSMRLKRFRLDNRVDQRAQPVTGITNFVDEFFYRWAIGKAETAAYRVN